MSKFKLVPAVLVSLLPANFLRLLGYRLLGYHIRGKIGFGTVIAVERARLGEGRIGAFNLFVGPMRVEIGEGAAIGHGNLFTCGFWTAGERYRDAGYARSLRIGARALVTSGHYFDLAGAFELGEGSWIAGTGSQFWTHGAGVQDRDVRIGSDCYLASAVRFAPGSAVGDRVLVAMGSVVTRKFERSNLMLGGVPARVLEEDYRWAAGQADGQG